ncbi:MAG: transcription antitermination factor NusB [Anaerolineaceae bacterium]|nr:transcription antitermination factor NusB [Anaerolineaceae bacterium]
MTAKKTKARIAALQTLFELDLAEHPLGTVLEQRAADLDLDEAQYDFALKLAQGVHKTTTQLDDLISRHAPEWPLDQVAVIDRNILRMALWEIAFYRETPLKVVINEAVELAKLYGTDSSPRFVNGVLGSLVESLEKIKQSILK